MPPTPFMGLSLQTVEVTPGPAWATDLNTALTTVDSHNHTSGMGAPIPTAGLALNADLTLNGFNLLSARALRMMNNGSPLSEVADVTELYVASGNLYYNNAIGQQVRITNGAGIDATSVGGFGGDYGTSTASAFYTSATSTFTFWQNTNMPAIMDMGPIKIHTVSDAVNYVELLSPTLSASYQLTFPVSLPASTKFLTVDSSGNIDDVYDVDGNTIQVVSNVIQLVPTNIVTAVVSGSSINSTSFVTVSTITQTNSAGRALEICLVTGSLQLGVATAPFNNPSATIRIVRDGVTIVYSTTLEILTSLTGTGNYLTIPASSIRVIDSSIVGLI